MSTEILIPLSYSDNPNYNGMIKSVIIAGNGTFEYEKTWIGERLVKESNYTVSDQLPQLKTSFKFDENLPKLPLEAFELMLAFYKGIYDKFQTEAQINFYYNINNLTEIDVDGKLLKLNEIKCLKDWGNQLISYVPVQQNSAALTATTDPIYEALRQQLKPYIETHSHNTMSAFRSGTDLDNSYYDGLQLVIGHITSETYDFHNWVTIGGKQYENLELDIIRQIVDLPETFTNKSMNELPNVPEEYYGQHTTRVYIKPKYVSTYNNTAYDDWLEETESEQHHISHVNNWLKDDIDTYDDSLRDNYDFEEQYYARRAHKISTITKPKVDKNKIVTRKFDPVSKTWVETTKDTTTKDTTSKIHQTNQKSSFIDSAQENKQENMNFQEIGHPHNKKDDAASSIIKLIINIFKKRR